VAEWMVGVDIGGTFTDVAATDTASRELRIAKVPSVPADPAQAVVNGLQTLFESGIRPQDVRFFAHGTTVATNALLEGKGARAGLLITHGYNALYELRGGTRPTGSDLIDTFYLKPAALIPLQRT
jgi:N-methylhydantoinase A